MKIIVGNDLYIEKQGESWDVVRVIKAQKEDAKHKTREKRTYHGTLEQALVKALDVAMTHHSALGNIRTLQQLINEVRQAKEEIKHAVKQLEDKAHAMEVLLV